MSTHETELLGAYCLGALESADAATVQAHLRDCPECRRDLDELGEVRELLGEVPPEALLDGAAEDNELLLARLLMRAGETEDEPEPDTVRLPPAGPDATRTGSLRGELPTPVLPTDPPVPEQHRPEPPGPELRGTLAAESPAEQTTRMPPVSGDPAGRAPTKPDTGAVGRSGPPSEETVRMAAAADRPGERPPASLAEARARRHADRRWYRGPLLVAAAAVVLAGVFAGGLLTGRQTAPAITSATGAANGARTIAAHSTSTGVGMSIDLVPKAGWVTVQGKFTGVTPGTACDIYLITRSGQRILAGAWIAPADADKVVVTVPGSAIIAPGDVAAIEIDTVAGQQLVVGHA
jgi:predicted anti-sigma-YlaC factor YlaD